MARFEYKIKVWEECPLVSDSSMDIHTRQTEMILNRLGDKGWELVQIKFERMLNPPIVWTVWKRQTCA